MAIVDSIGYGGTVTEDDVPAWRQSFPGTYGVVTAGDWRVAVKPGVDRTLTIATGQGYGQGVLDTSDDSTEDTVTLSTLASGTRWDLVVAHRNWSGSGGTTTFDKVTGTSVQTAVFGSRDNDPGSEDDQPLALVQVNGNGGGGVIATVIDLRTWQANGGAFASSEFALQYLNEVGTEIWIGAILWRRAVDAFGSATWIKIATPTEYYTTVTCDAAGAFSGTMPSGWFVSGPPLRVFTTVQSNTQFACASAVATSLTAFSGKCIFFTSGVGGTAVGFSIAVRIMQETS